MTELLPCGTIAAYRRHLRNGDEIDEACATANREDANRRRDEARAESGVRVRGAVDTATTTKTVDELEDALANLLIVRAAMDGAPANSLAALSKRRQELVTEIRRLESIPAILDAVDEISRRRAARNAWDNPNVRQVK